MRKTQEMGNATKLTKKASPKASGKKQNLLKDKVVGIMSNLGKKNKTLKSVCGKIRSTTGRITGYEQHIAVFGESGSGKTTLLSVFYGKQQGLRFSEESGYELLASDVSQGNQLLSQYHQIQDDLIAPTRLKVSRYEFFVRPGMQKKSKNAIRLVWHDYPGEWLTETKQGEENERKKKVFESLVKADVAYFLVDASKLKKEGSKYLKRLFGNFKDQLVRIHEDCLGNKKLPFKYFPRLWFICLSKADIFPEWTVQKFKKELEVASEEIANVERVLNTFVRKQQKVDFQSGYLLLSSLKVNAKTLKIENWEKTVGVDAIVPISFFAPIFRAYKWAKVKGVSTTALKKTFVVGGKAFSAMAPITASVIPFVTTTAAASVSWIPVIGPMCGAAVGATVATPLMIATGIFAGGGFLLDAISGGLAKLSEKMEDKLTGLQLMIKKLQLKIIEIRSVGICEIKDVEEYISQNK
jgi:hypothetical protein